MPDHVAVRHVDPDAGVVVDRGAGDKEDFIARVEPAEVRRSLGEDRTMHRGAEARRLLRRKRRWCAVIHKG
jgi:hypothetical protein